MAETNNLVRYLFFGFNLLIWILGIFVIGVGVYSRVENDSWKDLIKVETLLQAANLLIVAGLIVGLLGFLGCCGAIKKLQPLLVVYSVIVFLIFILQIAAGIYAYKNRAAVEKKLTAGVTNGIKKIYGKDDKASRGLSLAIDYFQKEVKCCGVVGPSDWLHTFWYTHNNTEHVKVPKSCCRIPATGCNKQLKVNDTRIFNQGCINAGKAYAMGNMKLIGGVGVVIGIIELLGIVFAMCLCVSFRRGEYETV